MDKGSLQGILREIHPEVDYDKEIHLVDDGIFDSLDIVSLISEIAVSFGIKIPANEIVPENFNSVAAILKLLEELE